MYVLLILLYSVRFVVRQPLQPSLALWPNKDFPDKRTKFSLDVDAVNVVFLALF